VKFLHLVWRSLMRRKLRTLFTALSIFIAFLLFGALMALRVAFGMGVDLAGQDRLVMIQKVSFIQPLPLSYRERIASTEGVSGVTHSSWFGGIYQDPKNFFAQFAVDPESWMQMYPEYVLPEAQKKAWYANRTGAVVGRALATRFGWKVGDRVPLRATIWRKADDSPWTFTIDGIYEAGTKGADETQFLRWLDLMGVQRHLKAAGIFARLWHRDGKPGYLADVPRTLGYVVEACERHDDLAALGELVRVRVLPAMQSSLAAARA